MTGFTIDTTPVMKPHSNPLNEPVDKNEIRIIVIGNMGKGKTRIMLLIARLFNMIAPNLKVVLHEDDYADAEVMLQKYITTQPEFTAEVLNKEKIEIHMYQMVTNYKGRLMGVGIKPAE